MVNLGANTPCIELSVPSGNGGRFTIKYGVILTRAHKHQEANAFPGYPDRFLA
jgi:hypothetical protein